MQVGSASGKSTQHRPARVPTCQREGRKDVPRRLHRTGGNLDPLVRFDAETFAHVPYDGNPTWMPVTPKAGVTIRKHHSPPEGSMGIMLVTSSCKGIERILARGARRSPSRYDRAPLLGSPMRPLVCARAAVLVRSRPHSPPGARQCVQASQSFSPPSSSPRHAEGL